eukprot:TRINITY_DN7208_c0_g1_i1.p1 TRINITY_DN7208_c0_g1~~TRINITY_DN7208_c0_g1_i1.p1  ORF type:complete len:444 (+),score=94.25 TRINITY_DN7208_c0_g1_i1:63-1334(+)
MFRSMRLVNRSSAVTFLSQRHARFLSKSAAACARDVVIVSAVRTPIGSFNGTLAGLKAPELGALAVNGAIKKANIDPSLVDECYMGNVVGAGSGQAPTRQAALNGGLPLSVPCTGVNKVCASGMKAIMLGAQGIASGQVDCVVAGGFESMSNVPYYLPTQRFGSKMGHGQVVDGIIKDGLWDAFDDHHMGNAGESCSRDYSIGREEQDAYALESYRRSKAAHESGAFKDEMISVTTKKGRKEVVITDDEEYHKVNLEKFATLRAAFEKDGAITAGNASTLNDGASALVLMSAEKAAEQGLKPLAYIRGYADAAHEPVKFPTAPALAVPKALAHAGLTVDDVDFWEINEAFSVVVLANMRILDIPHEKVNVNGGAVSLGHPIGCSGARIVTTLTHLLNNKGGKIGCATICNGGGGASAIVIERA